MRRLIGFLSGWLLFSPLFALGQNATSLKSALTLHVPFEKDLHAGFSLGEKKAHYRLGKELLEANANEEVKIAPGAGKFGNALLFTKKGSYRPQFSSNKILNYNDKNWNATVSIWLKLNPDKDLEPGYCDPVQIVGNDSKKGFIFLEWSKDETPRFFRYAVRPLTHIWNPTNISWAQIPFDKRPMVQVAKAPFTREKWTHVVFTLENINNKEAKPRGKLFLDGKLHGSIDNWDLTFGWDPAQVFLILGAAYVGHMDDLAVFNRVLTDSEVKELFELPTGAASLYR